MKTVTISEARRHLSKLMDEVRESGQEIVVTRREEEVCKITPISPKVEEKLDWAGWTEQRKRELAGMPMIEGSAMDADREGYHW